MLNACSPLAKPKPLISLSSFVIGGIFALIWANKDNEYLAIPTGLFLVIGLFAIGLHLKEEMLNQRQEMSGQTTEGSALVTQEASFVQKLLDCGASLWKTEEPPISPNNIEKGQPNLTL